MNRKLISLVAVLIAVVSFTVGGDRAEARNCGRQRNRCCQQSNNCCSQQSGYPGYRRGRNCGNGCGQFGNNWSQQTSYSSCQQNGCGNMANTCYAPATTTCCNQQSGVIQSGFNNGQPAGVTPASNNAATSPSTAPSPPVEPAKPTAPMPAA